MSAGPILARTIHVTPRGTHGGHSIPFEDSILRQAQVRGGQGVDRPAIVGGMVFAKHRRLGDAGQTKRSMSSWTGEGGWMGSGGENAQNCRRLERAKPFTK